MSNNEDERFLAMQEHPENYTNEQLSADDVQQTHDDLAQLKRAIIRRQQADEAVDVDAAWQEFASMHKVPEPRHRTWSKAAAVFVGLALTGLAYAAAVHFDVAPNIFAPKEQPTAAATSRNPTNQPQSAAPTVSDSLSTGVQTVVYDNSTLADILSDFATHYNVEVEYEAEALKSIRLFYQWDKSQPLERSVATLNGFDRFHISVADGVLKVENGGKEADE